MITKITLNNVASYKQEAVLETDKRINLLYGLNGTGKSTLSKFLQNHLDPLFSDCTLESSITTSTDEEIHVYNQKFIEDNFYNSPTQKGIFSLSKGNKDAKDKIDNASAEIKKLEKQNELKDSEQKTAIQAFEKKQTDAKNKVWQIKKDYAGGDRVLEYCLKGYMKSDLLFSYLKGRTKPATKPAKTVDEIKTEVQLLVNDTSQKLEKINLIVLDSSTIEQDEIWGKAIVGTANSTFSAFIKKIECSDWVQSGVQYLSKQESGETKCPFCQQEINKESLLQQIADCFDESYNENIESIKTMFSRYQTIAKDIVEDERFETNVLLVSLKAKYKDSFNKLKRNIQNNELSIKDKIEHPSKQIVLQNTSSLLNDVNEVINEANSIIEAFNSKIEKKEETLNTLKEEFWNNMRWDYDPILSSFSIDEKAHQSHINSIKKTIDENNAQIKDQKQIIANEQKNVVNIQEAIDHINSFLVDLGIDDFNIVSYGDDLYRIQRGTSNNNVFQSLSEGEKMVISFLYFVEECRGKKTATESNKKKIIVIDDPISSLSHIYVFNVGRLIQEEFLRSSSYEQVFVLTHSLYFFYELTDTNHDRREKNQKLFRLIKNDNGSSFMEMKYEEIQNDYHSYWCIVKDSNQRPALIANCMRNIIDYFFGFVEKTSYTNVFQRPELRQNKFDAFNRYMNRESHSIGQNIFDIKEFDYEVFKEAFHSVFKLLDYEEHYNKMMSL